MSDTGCEYAERKVATAKESEQLDEWHWGELPASSKQLAQGVVSQAVEDSAVTPDKPTNVPGTTICIYYVSQCVCVYLIPRLLQWVFGNVLAQYDIWTCW